MPPSSSIPAILLLSASEQLAVLEKRALRDMGVTQLSFMTSGLEAARLLADSSSAALPDVVVCAQKLGDMDSAHFCHLLRLHPRLKNLPTLLILSNDSEVEHCKTLGFNATALLGRPYSSADLKNVVLSLVTAQIKPAPVPSNADTREFEKALASLPPLKQERSPEDYYRIGRQSLQEGRWNDAIEAFQMALRDDRFRGEAELGLAAAWKNKGDTTQSNRCLADAAKEFVRFGQWERARAVYTRLLQGYPSAKNPFLAQAQQALRHNRHIEAAKCLAEGIALTPENQIRNKIAQICLTADNPADMLRNLESALSAAMNERGKRLAGSISKEFQKLHARREESRREAEAVRRHTVSRILEKEGDSAEGETPMTLPGDTRTRGIQRNARKAEAPGAAALNWREVTRPLGTAASNDTAIDEFAGGGDLISIIKYTWKMARGLL